MMLRRTFWNWGVLGATGLAILTMPAQILAAHRLVPCESLVNYCGNLSVCRESASSDQCFCGSGKGCFPYTSQAKSESSSVSASSTDGTKSATAAADASGASQVQTASAATSEVTVSGPDGTTETASEAPKSQGTATISSGPLAGGTPESAAATANTPPATPPAPDTSGPARQYSPEEAKAIADRTAPLKEGTEAKNWLTQNDRTGVQEVTGVPRANPEELTIVGTTQDGTEVYSRGGTASEQLFNGNGKPVVLNNPTYTKPFDVGQQQGQITAFDSSGGGSFGSSGSSSAKTSPLGSEYSKSYREGGQMVYENTDGTVTRKQADGSYVTDMKDEFGTKEITKDGKTTVTSKTKYSGKTEGKFNPDEYRSEDECAVSGTIMKSYQGNRNFYCDGTKTLVETSKITNQVTQTVGSAATQALGQMAQVKAQTEGTQAAALEGAAKAQRYSGYAQLGAGGINSVLGIWQVSKGQGHHKNRKVISAETGKADLAQVAPTGDKSDDGTSVASNAYLEAKNKQGVAHAIVDSTQMNNEIRVTQSVTAAPGTVGYASQDAKRNADINRKKMEMQKGIGQVGTRASAEQRKMGSEATQSGALSLITGAGQLVTGGFNMLAASELEKAAKKLRKAEGQNTQVITPPKWGGWPGADEFANRTPTVINGSGETAAEAAAEEAKLADAGNPLGDPLPIDDTPNALPSAPPAGSRTSGNPGGGGGGGSVVGSASTGPANGEGSGEGAAKMADNREKAEYGGGTAYSGGAQGGGDKGPDLSSLLAQFLPKKDEEDKPNNGIMDFGGRGLASDDNGSLLGRDANLFQRIHETMVSKHKAGNVGL